MLLIMGAVSDPLSIGRVRRLRVGFRADAGAKSFGTLFERLGRRAGMPFTIFPHMLRHACGYALANAGHDTRALQAWLGHKNIQHTVRYTELAPDRFTDFWR
jgi:site-specific recombinase XerD